MLFCNTEHLGDYTGGLNEWKKRLIQWALKYWERGSKHYIIWKTVGMIAHSDIPEIISSYSPNWLSPVLAFMDQVRSQSSYGKIENFPVSLLSHSIFSLKHW